MQLKNYSILDTRNAFNLVTNRIKHSRPSYVNYLRFKQGQIYSQPNRYFLYQDLSKGTAPAIKSYPNQQSVIKASHHLAEAESLHPEDYQIGVNHKTNKGYWKKVDRIGAGKNHIKFLTPKSSDKIFKAYKAHTNMRARNAQNTYQKSVIYADKTNLENTEAIKDIGSTDRARKLRADLAKANTKFFNTSLANRDRGKKVFDKQRVDIKGKPDKTPFNLNKTRSHNHNFSQQDIFKFTHNGPHRN